MKYERKLRTVSEGHDAEKKKLKDTLMAAEKLRREKWMDEQTRNLKDITVKGPFLLITQAIRIIKCVLNFDFVWK